MRAIRIAYILGFLEGTGAHLLDVIAGGLHVYRGFPLPSQVLFQLLLILDPFAAHLTLRRQPWGPVLGYGIMVADLAANWQGGWRSVWASPGILLRPYGLPVLTLFGLFVFVTAIPLRMFFADSMSVRRQAEELG